MPDSRVGQNETSPSLRSWVNADRTLAVWMYGNGDVVIATRESSDHLWGKGTVLEEELRPMGPDDDVRVGLVD